MIIVRLNGGLGNQLFQYAAGRALAEIRQTSLKLDISVFETYKRRQYSLQPFNICQNIATSDEVIALTRRRITRFENYLIRAFQLAPRYARTHIVEKDCFRYDPHVLHLRDNVYLEGFWQSEKYFKDIVNIIRLEFTVKLPQIGKNKEVAEQIARCNSVSLHVRRGDYVSNPRTKEVHGSCPLSYYDNCVQMIGKQVKDPHFFIFSDDPDWVRDNVNIDFPAMIISHNGVDKDYEDLRLMSQCRHHIIANSTFSWWGAWLNPSKEKIVFAPREWFADQRYDTRHLIPEGWKQI